jgi:hypothetical protein
MIGLAAGMMSFKRDGVFPFFVCTFLLVDWIGGRTSEKAA